MNVLRVNVVATATGLILMCGCGGERIVTSQPSLSDANRIPQSFVELPFSQLPNSNASLAAAQQYIEPLDKDSIEMSEYRGERYYHPVVLSHRIYAFISAYFQTGDQTYLDRAEKYTAKLIDSSHYIGDALYLPYAVNFAVHGDSANALYAPWYSGMAQGEFLGVLVRLYEFTEKEQYLALARSVFNSLLTVRGSGGPWVSRVDIFNFYWIEEYPHDENPGMTLNGYMAAVFGLYDFYRVTKDPVARELFDMSLTTLKHYLPRFRRPGQGSFYCLGHSHPATNGYHRLHISMLHTLANMTGDPFFTDMAETFKIDAATVSD